MNITPDQIADAIYIAEGGTNTSRPYGIMTKYEHTSPRQACINTIVHAENDYKVVQVDRTFIHVLSLRYCPPSCDLKGNENWQKNVIRILHL
jgi:hypothetical protein